MKNVFNQNDVAEILGRIETLTPTTKQLWGKMSVAQMLWHCNVTYELIYEPEKHKKPNFLVKFLLQLFVKPLVVGDKPYKQNGQTAPAFIVKSDKNFEEEKQRLIAFINKTKELGESYFDNRLAAKVI